jgi:hypothetical protein
LHSEQKFNIMPDKYQVLYIDCLLEYDLTELHRYYQIFGVTCWLYLEDRRVNLIP